MEKDATDSREKLDLAEEEEGEGGRGLSFLSSSLGCGGGGRGGGGCLPSLLPSLPFLGLEEVLFERAADALQNNEGVSPGFEGEIEGEEAKVGLGREGGREGGRGRW